MFDAFHFPDSKDYNKFFFYRGDSVWQNWDKPKNAKFVSMYLIGGGGGGGGGATQAAGVSRTGGGGGGCSAVAYGSFPACMIPDTLYIQVGGGGSQGPRGATGAANAGGAGGSGGLSYVAVRPSLNSFGIMLASGVAGAGGGGGGLTSAGTSTGGIAGTPFDSSIGQLVFGFISAWDGLAGSTGVAAGGNSTVFSNIPLTAGTAGGGAVTTTPSAGGSIQSNEMEGIFPEFNALDGGGASGLAGSGVASRAGSGGFCSINSFNNFSARYPMLFTGGTGGGGSVVGTGSDGGNGSYGCGGGGGGAGTSGSVLGGGLGGKGGDGLVIITAW